jgi:hypothetical protein
MHFMIPSKDRRFKPGHWQNIGRVDIEYVNHPWSSCCIWGKEASREPPKVVLDMTALLVCIAFP